MGRTFEGSFDAKDKRIAELEARLKFARKQLYQRKKKPLKKHGHETYKERNK